jgi:hypothetical protein
MFKTWVPQLKFIAQRLGQAVGRKMREKKKPIRVLGMRWGCGLKPSGLE